MSEEVAAQDAADVEAGPETAIEAPTEGAERAASGAGADAATNLDADGDAHEGRALAASAAFTDDGVTLTAIVDQLDDAPVRTPSAEVKATVEALIFASPEPITAKTLCKLLAEEPKEDVLAAIAALQQDYESRPGLQIAEVAGGYQIVTRPQLHEWVRRLFHERSTQKLTVAALETLAVIAYKQPITALEVGEVRGVNTSGVLTTLLERHLIKIVGRKNVVGRPFLYSTTREFLIRFGLKDLNDLPRVDDMAAALGFDPPAGLLEQTPREDVLPLDEKEAAEYAEPSDGATGTVAPD